MGDLTDDGQLTSSGQRSIHRRPIILFFLLFSAILRRTLSKETGYPSRIFVVSFFIKRGRQLEEQRKVHGPQIDRHKPWRRSGSAGWRWLRAGFNLLGILILLIMVAAIAYGLVVQVVPAIQYSQSHTYVTPEFNPGYSPGG